MVRENAMIPPAKTVITDSRVMGILLPDSAIQEVPAVIAKSVAALTSRMNHALFI